MSFDPLSPQVTLTCVSTGGPATTVTWTRDGAAVYYDATHVLTQTVTEQSTITYSNVLRVTGREPGTYQCSVTNDRGSNTSQNFTIEGIIMCCMQNIIMVYLTQLQVLPMYHEWLYRGQAASQSCGTSLASTPAMWSTTSCSEEKSTVRQLAAVLESL